MEHQKPKDGSTKGLVRPQKFTVHESRNSDCISKLQPLKTKGKSIFHLLAVLSMKQARTR